MGEDQGCLYSWGPTTNDILAVAMDLEEDVNATKLLGFSSANNFSTPQMEQQIQTKISTCIGKL